MIAWRSKVGVINGHMSEQCVVHFLMGTLRSTKCNDKEKYPFLCLKGFGWRNRMNKKKLKGECDQSYWQWPTNANVPRPN